MNREGEVYKSNMKGTGEMKRFSKEKRQKNEWGV